MTIAELTADLQRAGVHLWEDDGKLRFRAPRGVMNEERLVALRAHKEELLAQLRLGAGGSLPALESRPGERHEPFPITDVQAAYLVGRGQAFSYGGVGCHGYGELAFPELDVEGLERAWNDTVARHEMLRAVVDADGSQRVLPEVPPVRIPVLDLRAAAPERLEAGIRETRSEMDHRVYDPARWPLFDLRVTAGERRSVLHFSIDFLVADFVSLQLLLRELQLRYERPGWEGPALEASFRDYCAAERRLRDGVRFEQDRRYWWDRIDTLPPHPELPTLGRRGDEAPRFERWALRLEPERWRALRDRAAANGVTPSGAVLAAYAEVIGRFSRHQRFSLDVTLLNRLPLHPQVDQLVGDFTSVELLEVDAGAGATFAQRANAIQAQLWQDIDHRLCTGVHVLREIARRSGREAALFPVVFTSSVGLASGDDGAQPVWGELVHGISQTPQVWIDCQAMERGGRLELNWDVRSGIFPDGLVDAMFTAFQDLLERLAGDGGTWTSGRPVALPEAQRARRAAVNATERPLPGGLLHTGFLEQAQRHPDRPAVLTAHRTITYGQLAEAAAAVAACVVEHDAPRDCPVAIVMDKGPEQVAAALGILMAGRAYVPIDSIQPALRRELMLSDSGATLAMTQSWLGAAGELPVTAIPVDRLDGREARPDGGAGQAPDDLAYVIYTSGSTGTPKGVAITHRAALNTIVDIGHRYGLGPEDRVLGLSNLGFDLSVYDLFGPLSVGGALVLPDHGRRTDPSHWAELLAARSVTIWNTVPALMEMLVDYLESEAGVDAGSLRLAMLSGDWIPVSLPGRIRARLPRVRTISLGGATEAAIWSIAYTIEEVGEDWTSVPYGKPLANQSFHVLDAALEPAPDWVPGDLYIGGAGLACGYWHDPARTAERFIEHPSTGQRLYRTGDHGRYLPDGNIEFLGRDDAQIKLHGHRIELAEVEAALLSHPDVAATAAIVAGERTHRRLAAFVEPGRGGGEPEVDLAQLRMRTRAAADQVCAGLDTDGMLRFARQLDETALLGMLRALRSAGLFRDGSSAHTADEIMEGARVAPRHQRLVRRWLRGLESGGLVTRDGTGRFSATRMVDAVAVDAAWGRVRELRLESDTRSELIDYFRQAAEHLPELLRGDQDPLELLFPEGRIDIHEVAYNDNVLSRFLNRTTVTVLREVAEHWRGPSPMRVLEVGAGVGGTSLELIPALDGCDVEYLFTDVSPFFLNLARERFGDRPWVRCRPFDINADYRRQGLSPSSLGVVVCANVMHYAHDAALALERIRELLMPGGWLLFIETTRDNYQILTSMEFLFDATVTEFQDVRRGRDETFISRGQWLQLLEQAGAETAVCLPDADDPLATIGMYAFAARFKGDRRRVDADGVRTHLRRRLPEYMIPSELQVVDALPTTENAKIDRRRLGEWLPAPTDADAGPGAGEPPADELERALSEVWAAMLGLSQVGRDQDFFALGGDSLVAAQIVARTRESVPEAAGLQYDELLRALLERRTVAAFAASVRQGPAGAPGSGAPSGPSPIVVLSEGEGAPWVLVHDATGGLEAAAALVSRLGGGQPVLGLMVADAAAYARLAPESLVDELAEEYAARLLERDLREAHLVGYRGGGLLAAEVAIRLMEAGVRTALTVIASAPIEWRTDDPLAVEYLLARELGIDPADLGLPDQAAMAGILLGAEVPAAEAPAGVTRLERWELAGAADALAYLDVFARSLSAFATARPTLYAGDLTLLRPAEELSLWTPLREPMVEFWTGRCLGEVRVVDVPGDYFSCLEPPHGEAVAEALRAPALAGGAA